MGEGLEGGLVSPAGREGLSEEATCERGLERAFLSQVLTLATWPERPEAACR